MDQYISATAWGAPTPLGGTYNWEGPNIYGYAGIAIFQPSVDNKYIVMLDKMLDDGDLSTGSFRVPASGKPTFIIRE